MAQCEPAAAGFPSSVVARIGGRSGNGWEASNVHLGPGVLVGEGVVFCKGLRRSWQFPTGKRIEVGTGAVIGENATIRAGVAIGEYAVVAPGAVVCDDVPAHGAVSGNPAALTGFVCKCGAALRDLPANWVTDAETGGMELVALMPGATVRCDCGECFAVDALIGSGDGAEPV